jgi:hypothetical protein
MYRPGAVAADGHKPGYVVVFVFELGSDMAHPRCSPICSQAMRLRRPAVMILLVD